MMVRDGGLVMGDGAGMRRGRWVAPTAAAIVVSLVMVCGSLIGWRTSAEVRTRAGAAWHDSYDILVTAPSAGLGRLGSSGGVPGFVSLRGALLTAPDAWMVQPDIDSSALDAVRRIPGVQVAAPLVYVDTLSSKGDAVVTTSVPAGTSATTTTTATLDDGLAVHSWQVGGRIDAAAADECGPARAVSGSIPLLARDQTCTAGRSGGVEQLGTRLDVARTGALVAVDPMAELALGGADATTVRSLELLHRAETVWGRDEAATRRLEKDASRTYPVNVDARAPRSGTVPVLLASDQLPKIVTSTRTVTSAKGRTSATTSRATVSTKIGEAVGTPAGIVSGPLVDYWGTASGEDPLTAKIVRPLSPATYRLGGAEVPGTSASLTVEGVGETTTMPYGLESGYRSSTIRMDRYIQMPAFEFLGTIHAHRSGTAGMDPFSDAVVRTADPVTGRAGRRLPESFGGRGPTPGIPQVVMAYSAVAAMSSGVGISSIRVKVAGSDDHDDAALERVREVASRIGAMGLDATVVAGAGTAHLGVHYQPDNDGEKAITAIVPFTEMGAVTRVIAGASTAMGWILGLALAGAVGLAVLVEVLEMGARRRRARVLASCGWSPWGIWADLTSSRVPGIVLVVVATTVTLTMAWSEHLVAAALAAAGFVDIALGLVVPTVLARGAVRPTSARGGRRLATLGWAHRRWPGPAAVGSALSRESRITRVAVPAGTTLAALTVAAMVAAWSRVRDSLGSSDLARSMSGTTTAAGAGLVLLALGSSLCLMVMAALTERAGRRQRADLLDSLGWTVGLVRRAEAASGGRTLLPGLILCALAAAVALWRSVAVPVVLAGVATALLMSAGHLVMAVVDTRVGRR